MLKRILQRILDFFSRRRRRDRANRVKIEVKETPDTRSEQVSAEVEQPKPKPEIRMPKHVRIGLRNQAVTPRGLRIAQLMGTDIHRLGQINKLNLLKYMHTGILQTM